MPSEHPQSTSHEPAPPRLRCAFLIDGFNLYHSIRDNPLFCDYRWLNLDALARAFIAPSKEVITAIFFFTALPNWDAEKRQRHQRLLRIYTDLGVIVKEGIFLDGTRTCEATCGETYPTREEKNTDINICLELLRLGRDDLIDRVYLITADSDQSASIRAFKELHPRKQVYVISPPGRHSSELQQCADGNLKISLIQLKASLLPDPYICRKNDAVIPKPHKWNTRPTKFPVKPGLRKFTSD